MIAPGHQKAEHQGRTDSLGFLRGHGKLGGDEFHDALGKDSGGEIRRAKGDVRRGHGRKTTERRWRVGPSGPSATPRRTSSLMISMTDSKMVMGSVVDADGGAGLRSRKSGASLRPSIYEPGAAGL